MDPVRSAPPAPHGGLKSLSTNERSTDAAPPLPQNRPAGTYVPPPLPTSRPKAAYTPPSKSRTSSVCSSSTASPVLSRKSPSEIASSHIPNQDHSKKEPANLERPQRPMSGPRFSNSSSTSVAGSTADTTSSDKLTPKPRPRVSSCSEKNQSGGGTPENESLKINSETESSTNKPPPLPSNRPSRKYERGLSFEAKKETEKKETINKNVSDNNTIEKMPEKPSAVYELEKAVEQKKKPVPPQTSTKPPKPAVKPLQQPKPTARIAIPPPPSSPKSDHKISSPMAIPRRRVTSTNSEEVSEVKDKLNDKENNVVVPNALSVSDAIKGLNKSLKVKGNSDSTNTKRTTSPFNTGVSKPPKPSPPEKTSHSPVNPFSLSKATNSKTETVSIDASTLSAASKGLSAVSSTMSAFETKPKPQAANRPLASNRPPASNWSSQVPDAATINTAAKGLSAMSSMSASVSQFQSNSDNKQQTTGKSTNVSKQSYTIPDAATISTAAKGLSAMASISASVSQFQSNTVNKQQTTGKSTNFSKQSYTIPDPATVSNTAKGLSLLSSMSSSASSKSRPVPVERVQYTSQTTTNKSTSWNPMNQKPLIPQKAPQFVSSQSNMKDIADLFDPIATEKPQQTKTLAQLDSNLLLAPVRKAPLAPKSKPRASPTPNSSKQVSAPSAQNKSANVMDRPQATIRPTIIRPSAKPSNKKKAPPRPSSGPNLKNMKKKAPMQPSQPRKSNGKTKRPAPMRPGGQTAGKSNLPPRPGPNHPLFKYTVEKPHGIALFSFQATNVDELSFEKDDVIILIKEVNSDWFCGQNKNKEGIFPKNFINVVKPLSPSEKEVESQLEEITGPCAVALHAYESDASGDLRFSAGDNIKLLEKIDDQWYKGECNGDSGMFPKNYVEIIEDISESKNIKNDFRNNISGPRCKARFDYEGDESSDLPLKEGDVIQLIARVGDEWLKGELNGQTGIFPQAYVEIIEDLPVEANDGSTVALSDFTGADSSELNFKTGDKINVKSRVNGEWLIGELNGIEGSFPANFVDNIPDNLPSAANSPCTVPSTASLQGTCTALFDFEAADEAELTLNQGDTITLIETVGDDWLRGRLRGKEGIFPKNFVEIQEGSSKMTVRALFDFNAEMPDDLGFKVNDLITDVVSYTDDWYEGSLNGKVGRFPANFVEVISS